MRLDLRVCSFIFFQLNRSGWLFRGGEYFRLKKP
jgi:hypothetical protein